MRDNKSNDLGYCCTYLPCRQAIAKRKLKNNYYVELDFTTTTLNKSLLIVSR